jgi:L-lactate dehydrogenase complex protein LldE
MHNSTTPVTLFIPCLVDQVYPEIGMAMVKILKHFGYDLEYLPEQTCCGQPAFNAGYHDEARKVAGNFINVFEQSELIVAPSGSCTAMVRNYYPELFAGTDLEEKAIAVSKNLMEFSEFMAQENLIDKLSGSYSGRVSFHNSCHSYREIGIKENPIKIFKKLSGFEFVSAPGEPVCCGFGGLFSVKYADISASMANTRLKTFEDLQIDTLVVNDPGCIMHMRQEAIDRKIDMKIIHLTEFLAEALFHED